MYNIGIISGLIYTHQAILVPYWKNKNIHNIGNTGVLGNLHAMSAPLMTKYIDMVAYEGRNIRKEVYNSLDGSVLDMCCGTGFSTKPYGLGIDTSSEMLRFSNLFNPGSAYHYGNAETYGNNEEYDTVTIMFSFHEMPAYAHRIIIRNAIRVAREKVVIVDISTDYKPSKNMLSGEPYLLDYLDSFSYTIDDVVRKDKTNRGRYATIVPRWNKTTLVENHVDMWVYNKDKGYAKPPSNDVELLAMEAGAVVADAEAKTRAPGRWLRWRLRQRQRRRRRWRALDPRRFNDGSYLLWLYLLVSVELVAVTPHAFHLVADAVKNKLYP